MLRFSFLVILVCILTDCMGQNAIPRWLIEKHGASVNSNDEIRKYVRLNDSISYCLKNRNTETCQKNFIITYNKTEEVAQYELGRSCDHDLSRPSFRWKEFRVLSDTTFEIFEIIERVPVEFVDENGMVKAEFDYYEIRNKTRDTTTTVLIVDKFGRLK